MSFQLKDFTSIVASMLNHARSTTAKITDYQPGSVARTLMEGPGVEIEELYLQIFNGIRDAIPVATFLSFGYDILPPVLANGFVSISSANPLSADIFIPAGTAFTSTDGRVYASSAAVTWASGSSLVRVPVNAPTVGLAGNAAAGVITSSPSFGPGYSIGNAAITNGHDTETDAERFARFSDFIASLSRGTVTACLYGVRQARILDANGNIYESVVRSGIVESPGYVVIYIYTNRGEPSTELLSAAQVIIDGKRDPVTNALTPGYRAAGVRMDVVAMQERAVNIGVKVGMSVGYVLTSAVQQQLSDAFALAISSVVSGTTLYLGTLVQQLLTVPNVQTVIPTGTDNIVCGENEALVPGALTVTAL
jgi:hypothetical protein